jgi:hypothetical protein
MKKKHKDLLRKWLGKEQVIVVDKNHIQDKVPGGVLFQDRVFQSHAV